VEAVQLQMEFWQELIPATLTDAMGCSGSYTVTVTDTHGSDTFIGFLQTNILCNGNNTGDATVATAAESVLILMHGYPQAGLLLLQVTYCGTYTCTVTDSAGCTQNTICNNYGTCFINGIFIFNSNLCNGETLLLQ